MQRVRLMFIVLVSLVVSLLGTAGIANAAPAQVDPVQSLIDAGVPANIAQQAGLAHPAAATDVVTIAHPGMRYSFPGTQVDAVLDHDKGTVTVIQRWLTVPSQLSVGWVNLANGKAGVSGLPDTLPIDDPMYANYSDHAGTIATGNGSVALVVFGRIPGWTGLIPLAPEYFGIMTPSASVVRV
ncbi:hypothetical protein [Antrihabitans cavernicola]|uniref:DUF1942 domain-containing protein n=1 Tax=Antrihabitans cavernicola TaxID=2495913 RepID=A0A5A7SFP7_9NOCA|nr:hypothetical protein [Spelaeibacter cavernicola]KAA0024950.1 hypothetical protein FOY51_03255 [Spelaeibacter cavernicola]